MMQLKRLTKGNVMTLVALAQMTSIADIETNWKVCVDFAKQAQAQGAELLCLPENFAFMGGDGAETLQIAESLDGPLLCRYLELAKKYNIWLSLGGFPERIPNSNKMANTHIIVDNNGNTQAVYRKIHLFAIDVKNRAEFNEADNVEPGDQVITCESPLGTLGLSICYDVRFPYLYSSLAQREAKILLIPAAFTQFTGKAHWETLLRARAIENQCYVIAAAQTGTHNAKRKTYGHAMCIDPWGRVLIDLGEAPGMQIINIDLNYVSEVREQMPVLKHHRAL